MAAFNMGDPMAVVSPGGVGFDINCGVRLLRTNLFQKDIEPIKEQLAQVKLKLRIKKKIQNGCILGLMSAFYIHFSLFFSCSLYLTIYPWVLVQKESFP